MIKKGRANILIDGQFGSTGKGLIAAWIGRRHEIDVAVSNASANAGHTAYIYGEKFVARHLPMAGVLNPNSLIYLGAASIIDIETLLQEVKQTGVQDRLAIHPRASIITEEDVRAEEDLNSAVSKIASTRHGVGAALARKIRRSASLARDYTDLKPWIRTIDLNEHIKNGQNIFIEVPQGFDLSLNSGLSYPHCTCREITVSQALADCQLHPATLGFVTMSLRTYPIRVGNLVVDGEQVGWSGPCYDDQREMTWDEIGVPPEITTVTQKVRRVFTFSFHQYKRACMANRPDYVFLNFVNYLTSKLALEYLVDRMAQTWMRPTHYGTGPFDGDVYTDRNIEEYWETKNAAQTAQRYLRSHPPVDSEHDIQI